MDIALKLLADDFSADSIFSLGIYLIIKSLSCINSREHKNCIHKSLQRTSVDYPNYLYTVKELINEIDINEIGETIESYRNENESDYSPKLIIWLNEVKKALKLYNYERICSYLCEIVGLKGLRQLMILELLDAWYNQR